MRWILSALVMAPAALGAQIPMPIRPLGAIIARTTPTLGGALSIRQLTDGRVIVNDYGTSRLLKVKPATPDLVKEFGEAWHAVKACGACSAEHEMGIGPDGDVLYVN